VKGERICESRIIANEQYPSEKAKISFKNPFGFTLHCLVLLHHDAPYGPKNESPDQSLVRAFRKVEEASHCHNVYDRDVDAHWPVDISLLVMVGNEAWKVAPHFQ